MAFFKKFSTTIQLTSIIMVTALVAISLLAVRGAQAAPAFVQVRATKISSGTTSNTAFSQANGAGNLIVVHVLWGNAGNVTLTDTKNNTYTPVGPATRFNNSQASSQVFYAKNISAAAANSNTVKAVFGTSINNWAMVYAHEYSGMDKLSPVDVSGATTGMGTNMSGSLTTHQNNSLIFAAAVAYNGAVNGAGAGFTVRSTLSQDWTMDKVAPTAGPTPITATRTGNGEWVLQMVAFRPDGTPPPNQPPTVSLTQPANNAVVNGSVWLRATAADTDGGVTKVEFYDGSQLLYTDTTTPYEFQLDTTTLTNTTHTLTAKAFDASTNTTSSPVQTTVDNAAPGVPANLQASAITSTQAILAFDASTDNLSMGGYKIFKDDVQIATTTATTFQATGLNPNTAYNFAVSAYDGIGNTSAQSAPLAVTTLPDTAPQVGFAAPGDGATVRSAVAVTATATDDVGVAQVVFAVDGATVATDTTTPYSFTLDTTNLSSGPHTLSATATDTSNQSTIAQITITVDNQPPTAPTDVTAQADSSSQISLSWSASSGDLAYYEVYRDGVKVATSVTGTAYTDTGLAPETTYSYVIEAYDTVGNKAASAPASATTLASPDTTPAVLSNGQPGGTLAAGTVTALLSIDTNEAATCRYATVAGTAYSAMPDTFTTTGGGNHTSTLSGLADGQSYTYCVRCQDQANNVNTTDYTVNFSVATPPSGGVVFPLRASSNGRYLEDQNGTPFLMTGDSPQGIIASLMPSQVDTYLDNRKTYNFNTLWINLLSREQTGGPDLGQTPDNLYPFSAYLPTGNDKHHYDLTAHNDAYFARASEIINKALDRDMLVILDPIETMDHLQLLRNNGTVRAKEHGRYLGTVFSQPNIIWLHGNDFNTYLTNPGDRELVRLVGEGIRETDNTNAMQTVLGYATPSEAMDLVYDPGDPVNDGTACGIFDPHPNTPCDMAWAPFINIDTVYAYGPSYEYVANEYARAASYNDGSYNRGRIPVYLAETFYDFEDMVPGRTNRLIKEFRWQQYWAMLSGATGHTYGNYDSVYLDGDWMPKLNTPAAANFSRWNQFFTSYPWQTLVPDQSLITAGAEGGEWNRATASVTPNGALGIAYIPNARNITINMARFSGQVNAQWFNPVTGTYQAIGTFANSGTRQFTPPAGNHVETNWYGGTETSTDWVLVLQVGGSIPDPDTQAPGVPTNLQANAVSSSQINLSWTASPDNVGVTGYKVYRDGVLVNGNVVGTSYQDGGLQPNTTYAYTVSAYDAAGNGSLQSASASATTPQSSTPPATAFLKAAWGFNEGSGTTVADASQNGNVATMHGANPWGAGRYGSGFSLGGTSSAGNYLTVPNSTSLDIGGSALTLSLWINPLQTSGDTALLGKFWNASTWTDPYYQYGLELWGGNQPVFQIGTATGLKTVLMGSTVPYGQWSHLAVVYDGTNAKFYLNSSLVSTQSLNGNIVARGNSLQAGADQSINQFFKGTMDDVRIYNTVLTPTDIQTDMNNSL